MGGLYFTFTVIDYKKQKADLRAIRLFGNFRGEVC
jgi:hypothetical protein